MGTAEGVHSMGTVLPGRGLGEDFKEETVCWFLKVPVHISEDNRFGARFKEVNVEAHLSASPVTLNTVTLTLCVTRAQHSMTT